MGARRGKINRAGDGALAFDTGVFYSLPHEREMTTMRATDEQQKVARAFVSARAEKTPLTVYPGPMPRTMADAYAIQDARSEEHTSELQSLMRISYAVFCLKKKKKN